MKYDTQSLEEYDTDELHAILDAAQQNVAVADENHNAVAAHDARCLIDQVTAILESRDEATAD